MSYNIFLKLLWIYYHFKIKAPVTRPLQETNIEHFFQ